MKTCVFAGTFDPPTNGHKSVVDRALKIFDRVTVAVAVNTQKSCLFTREERLKLLGELFGDDKRVKVRAFDGTVVDLLKEENTPFYVRGVRDCIDFEYENRDRYASERLDGDIITIYLPAPQEQLHVSSTLIRNSVMFEKDYESYIPKEILDTLKKMLEAKDVHKAD